MKNLNEFIGFPIETIDFLINLKLNNNREWFNEHKNEYQKYIIEPAKSFVVTLGERLQKEISKGIRYELNLNGSGSIMRIYRDVRFKKDKTPYNTRLRTVFWEGSGKKMEHPGYFIGFDAAEGRIYSGLYRFEKSYLQSFRNEAISKQGHEIFEVIQSLKAKNYTVGGEHYKRVPSGFDKFHPRASLFRYNGLYAVSPAIEPIKFTNSKIIDICLDHCLKMAPLHRLLVKIAN